MRRMPRSAIRREGGVVPRTHSSHAEDSSTKRQNPHHVRTFQASAPHFLSHPFTFQSKPHRQPTSLLREVYASYMVGGSVFAENNIIKDRMVLKSACNYSLYPPACWSIRNTLPFISDCCLLIPGTNNQYSDHLHTAKAPR